MYAVVSAVELGQLLQTPPFHSGKIVRSGFICGFIELHPGGLEDLGSILAAPDGDQCIRLAVHKELGRLDPGSSLGLGRRIWDDGVIPIFPEQFFPGILLSGLSHFYLPDTFSFLLSDLL